MNKYFTIAIRFWKPISIGIFIMVLCLIPAKELSKLNVKITFADLVVHWFMFTVFTALVFSDLDKYYQGRTKKPSPLVISLLIGASFGITTEILQYLLTFLNRTGSSVDLLFDFIGSFTGIAIVKLTKRKSDSVS